MSLNQALRYPFQGEHWLRRILGCATLEFGSLIVFHRNAILTPVVTSFFQLLSEPGAEAKDV